MTQNVRHAALALGLAAAIALPGASSAQRRGEPGTVVPMTDVSITAGGAVITGRVDAKCGMDAKATAANTRFHYVVMYPWFGQRVAADKPQWRFNLSIRRTGDSDTSSQFVFSFRDGKRGGTIQTVAFGERMGSGTVRVERQGKGARFQVEGRTAEGVVVRATIVCSEFNDGGAVGG